MSADGRWSDLWRRWQTRIGVGAVAVGLVCGSATYAALIPSLGPADETAHIDYAYQVWHGQMPVFEEGITFTPGPHVPNPGVQWEAHHPPLYYLLLAPAVGPLIDSGHWNAAVLAARGISVLIAGGCVLALAWAGSLLATRRRWAWSIAVPAVIAPITPFLHVGGVAFNDNLAALLTVLSLGMGILMLRQGPSRRRLILVAVFCGLGSLARANFMTTLLVVSAMTAVAVWLHDGSRTWPRIRRSVLAAAVPVAAALVASGWFYWRNVQRTGYWSGAQPEFGVEHMGRHRIGFRDIVTAKQFWTDQLRLLEHRAVGAANWLGPWILLTVAALGLITCAVWAIQAGRRRTPPTPAPTTAAAEQPITGSSDAAANDSRPVAAGRAPSPRTVQAMIVLGLIAQMAGVVLAQALFAGVGGATHDRYVLPGLLSIGALFAAAVLAPGRRLAGLALFIYLAVTWGLYGQWVSIVTDGYDLSGSTINNVPFIAVWAGIALLAVAIVVQSLALTDWSRRERAGAAGPLASPHREHAYSQSS